MREVVKTVLEARCAAVVLVHNHPSQICEPSAADELITKRLRAALEVVDVRVVDHLIVGGAELMSFAESVGACVIIKGLRAVSDFEYEFQMAGMNAQLNPEIETVFLMASDRYQFIASRFVKEICALGGDISHFVSPRVATHLFERFGVPRAKTRRRTVGEK